MHQTLNLTEYEVGRCSCSFIKMTSIYTSIVHSIIIYIDICIPLSMFKQSVPRRKAVLLLWIVFAIFSFVFVFVILSFCSLQPCDNLLGKAGPLGSLVCDVFLYFVIFPHGFTGQVWYLIVLMPDLCLLPYFSTIHFETLHLLMPHG